MDKEKIIDALKTIRDVCDDSTCTDCPFGRDYHCMIKEYDPVEWMVNEKDEKWYALLN